MLLILLASIIHGISPKKKFQYKRKIIATLNAQEAPEQNYPQEAPEQNYPILYVCNNYVINTSLSGIMKFMSR